MKRKLFIMLLACALSLQAAGAVFTIEEAVALGLKNNTQILAAGEVKKASEGRNAEAVSGVLPKLTFSGNYNYISDAPSMSINIPTGPFTSIDKTVVTGANDNWVFNARLTQQLFDWGRMFDNIAGTEAVKKAADKDYEAARCSVASAVKQLYYAVVFTKEVLLVSEESLRVAKEHLAVAEQKYKEGASSSFEVLRSRVQVSNLRPAFSKAGNSVELAKLNLKIALGLPYDAELQVSGRLAERATPEHDYGTELLNSFSARPELIAARCREEAARFVLDTANTFDKPSLSGFASYNYQNPYYAQLSWTQSWNAGLNLNLPLYDGNFGAAKIRQAEADLAIAKISTRRLEDATASELKQLLFLLVEAKERLAAQKDAVSQADEYHKISQVGFKSGTMTNLEVIDAELSLMNARIGFLQALYDRDVVEAGIERLAGKYAVSR